MESFCRSSEAVNRAFWEKAPKNWDAKKRRPNVADSRSSQVPFSIGKWEICWLSAFEGSNPSSCMKKRRGRDASPFISLNFSDSPSQERLRWGLGKGRRIGAEVALSKGSNPSSCIFCSLRSPAARGNTKQSPSSGCRHPLRDALCKPRHPAVGQAARKILKYPAQG